ncbi:Hypoxia-inducible factor 1 [Trichinella pseudospiralis]|uniref:Hypoxia-inducible factor 1 n=1 Tax=Trichinella pseudospiralis TaxID=6337 RepID=A0A0V1K131_TRIPS|nr:Hypoxia-inducible factor 1 [Trichinella pseudospiralis]
MLPVKKRNVEKRREKSRHAARYRRQSEAHLFTDLYEILPLTTEPTFYHLDRIAVLRVAAALCRLRAVTPAILHFPNQLPALKDRCHVEQSLYDCLDNSAILIVDSTGLIIYVSLSISFCIGITQIKSVAPYIDGHVHSFCFDVAEEEFFSASTCGNVIRTVCKFLSYAFVVLTDLIGRSLFEYVHHDDAVDLNQAFQTCDENAEERSLMLRVKSALSARGRSLSLKSCVYKAFSFTLKYAQSKQQNLVDVALRSLNQRKKRITENENFCRKYFFMFGSIVMQNCQGVSFPAETVVTRHSMNMQICYVGNGLAELLGYDAKLITGQSFFKLVHPDDVIRFTLCVQLLYEKGYMRTGYYRMLTQDGNVLWVITEGSVVSENNRGHRAQRVLCFHRPVGRACSSVDFSSTVAASQYVKQPTANATANLANTMANISQSVPVFKSRSLSSEVPARPVVTFYDSALPKELKKLLVSQLSMYGTAQHTADNNSNSIAYPNDWSSSFYESISEDQTAMQKGCMPEFKNYDNSNSVSQVDSSNGPSCSNSCTGSFANEAPELSSLTPFVNFQDLLTLQNEGYQVNFSFNTNNQNGSVEQEGSLPLNITMPSQSFKRVASRLPSKRPYSNCKLNESSFEITPEADNTIGDPFSPWHPCKMVDWNEQFDQDTPPDLISLETANLLESAMMTLFQGDAVHNGYHNNNNNNYNNNNHDQCQQQQQQRQLQLQHQQNCINSVNIYDNTITTTTTNNNNNNSNNQRCAFGLENAPRNSAANRETFDLGLEFRFQDRMHGDVDYRSERFAQQMHSDHNLADNLGHASIVQQRQHGPRYHVVEQGQQEHGHHALHDGQFAAQPQRAEAEEYCGEAGGEVDSAYQFVVVRIHDLVDEAEQRDRHVGQSLAEHEGDHFVHHSQQDGQVQEEPGPSGAEQRPSETEAQQLTTAHCWTERSQRHQTFQRDRPYVQRDDRRTDTTEHHVHPLGALGRREPDMSALMKQHLQTGD